MGLIVGGVSEMSARSCGETCFSCEVIVSVLFGFWRARRRVGLAIWLDLIEDEVHVGGRKELSFRDPRWVGLG